MTQEYQLLIIIGLLCIVGMALVFIFYPKKIKEWLIWACSQAELILGSGTGMLKLREVYDMFIKQYPLIAKIVPFSVFKKWTEESLVVFKDWLENNPKAQEIFGGDTNETE
jgi:hypothetical protein